MSILAKMDAAASIFANIDIYYPSLTLVKS